MCEYLPFCNIDDNELHEVLNDDMLVSKIYNRLSDQGLKDHIINLSKNEYFNSLDSAYYTIEQFNNKMNRLSDSCELSIFHLNIRSLNSKVSEFCVFINILKCDFDVIVLSEIWSTNIEFFSNILPNYSFYYNLPMSTNVGGIGVFIKDCFKIQFRHDLRLPSNDLNKIENLWFEILKNKNKYVIGGIYRHPNQSVDKFSDLLEVNLIKLCSEKATSVIVGDININLLQYDSNRATGNYLNNLLIHNFLPTLLLPTRITNVSSTLIDHIYVFGGCNSKKSSVISSGNIFSDISDHLSNFVVFSKLPTYKMIKERPLIRLYTLKNCNRFRDLLSAVDWSALFDGSDDVDICYNIFINKLTMMYEDSFPLTRMSRRAFKDKKWITSAIKTSSKQKSVLYKKWIVSGNKSDEIKYKKYKNIFKSVAHKAEALYYKEQFNTKANSIKQIWKNLNMVISAKKYFWQMYYR